MRHSDDNCIVENRVQRSIQMYRALAVGVALGIEQVIESEEPRREVHHGHARRPMRSERAILRASSIALSRVPPNNVWFPVYSKGTHWT